MVIMYDELDIKILREMEKSPDFSLQELAEILGISKGTVRNRIMKLKNEGIILNYNVRINYRAIGEEDAFIGLDISPEEFINSLEEIKKIPCVKELYSTTGDHVAIAYVVDNNKSIMDCVKRITQVKGIRKVYPAFVQDILK